MPTSTPGPGEVRIRIAVSGINPGDIKKRQDAFGYGMPYARVIPHSDGAGTVDAVGPGVAPDWLGRRVWCYGAQTYRPFGTAAEYTVVPMQQAVPLPDAVSLEQGACLGIPGITAHRAVHVAGPVDGRTVLVQGGAGAVGLCAVHLANRAGALVIATVRSATDERTARRAGASVVLVTGADLVDQVLAHAPNGVDHVVDVAFGANIATNGEMLALGGSIAAYATDVAQPQIPFWPLLFKNVRIFLVGSDDVPVEAKVAAAEELNAALVSGWAGYEIAERLPLEEIARAHELIERPIRPGRVILTL
jgi:NADPH2:quinone reductase